MHTLLLAFNFPWRSPGEVKTLPAGVDLIRWDCGHAGSSWLVWSCEGRALGWDHFRAEFHIEMFVWVPASGP